MTPQEEGRRFEEEIAKEFGLKVVPGSGNQWYAKLDVYGKGARWSMKYTAAQSYRLTQEDLTEAYVATQGISGDGSVPLMMLRIGEPEFDVVVMRKPDFVSFQAGELQLIGTDTPKAGDQRRARARVPVLLRNNGDN